MQHTDHVNRVRNEMQQNLLNSINSSGKSDASAGCAFFCLLLVFVQVLLSLLLVPFPQVLLFYFSFLILFFCITCLFYFFCFVVVLRFHSRKEVNTIVLQKTAINNIITFFTLYTSSLLNIYTIKTACKSIAVPSGT